MIKRGFTLIELLVVISIISLLSSILLASLSQARTKARNIAITGTMIQYRTALESYAIDHDQYPYSGWNPGAGITTNSYVCLGAYANGCGSTANPTGVHSWDQNTTLQNSLQNYYPAFPPVGDLVELTGGASWIGAQYACYPNTIVYDASHNPVGCTKVVIDWRLAGQNQNCAPGTIDNPNIDYSACELILSQ